MGLNELSTAQKGNSQAQQQLMERADVKARAVSHAETQPAASSKGS